MQPEPPPGANADEVNAWWNSLTQDEREVLRRGEVCRRSA
jgi:hypothetical protein